MLLNKPAAGDTDWTTEINDNWTEIEGAIDQAMCQGRLTLTSGTPVTTSDVTSAGTVYFAPYRGNRIALYDGSTWNIYTFTERSLALSSLTSGKNYDVFIYDNSGTLTLELSAAWTNDTTRADALTTQDGIRVKSGATTRRYLGTIRTTSTSTTEDSEAKRFVLNYYNRVRRALVPPVEATDSWTYAVNAWRQANGSSSNQVEYISNGEDSVCVTLCAAEQQGSPSGGNIGIGLDSTTANSAKTFHAGCGTSSLVTTHVATYVGVPAEGYHKLTWIEISRTGTITFIGDRAFSDANYQQQSGMVAICMA